MLNNMEPLTDEEQGEVEKHLPLVYSILNRVCRDDAIRDDLFQEGILGLIRAVKRRDDSKGAWAVYAKYEIRGRMIHWLKINNVVHVPIYAQGSNKGCVNVVSMDADIGDGSGALTYHGCIEDGDPGPEKRVASIELLRVAQKAITKLPKTDFKNGLAPRDLQGEVMSRKLSGETSVKIAADYGYSPARINQINQRGLQAMRNEILQATG